MILTGKCKEKFLEWFSEPETYFYRLNNTCQNALIIEFFDSVGIIINIVNQDLQRWFYYEIKTTERIQGFNLVRTRQEATEEAIKKSNEIYNERISL